MALFFTLFTNYSFYKNVLEVYPLGGINNIYILSLTVVLFSFILFLFTLLSSRYSTKFILISTLISSSFSSYFMNTYHVVIDSDMLRNAIQTNLNESLDLLSIKLLLYVVFLGLLPSFFVYRANIEYASLKTEMFRKIKTTVLALLIIIVMLFSFSKFYTSFFREHKPLRYYTNPPYWIYSIGDYISKTLNSGEVVVKSIAMDAKITPSNQKAKLVIMVVGEATRADHLSLNGYKKATTPLLEQENIINFSNMYACGTSTAHSVPCMFSMFTRDNYSYKKGISHENVLDVLYKTNEIDILWRDNNSDSKGVALRVAYEDYKDPKNNTLCQDRECRDEGMLVGLDGYIEQHNKKDIFIVLHQMGNHGPAYFKRYPKEFEKFRPICQSNQLENCTQESISNAYDNALLYTDYFLSKVINMLKKYENTYQTSMLYMSDHGESLGENGLYLHGLPYFMAPDAQTHIGAVVWFGKNNRKRIDPNKIYSHDNLFHTLLGLFQVETNVYNEKMDMFR
ncbi:MAG: sulfatase [uncultured Sulfurovum sp.]|uniref:Sulfatase n=1 Tax=uncultured Sulfurovum sp. TaxID=269237 RepID=A0A6S6S201_9BACT|nr:MAG: sulfatase [uncultured Sulfurovum sp.]